MARSQIAAGVLGAITGGVLPNGRYRARASLRDDGGVLHRLSAVAHTDENARADVRRQAAVLGTGGTGALSPKNTVDQWWNSGSLK
jgi:hypothetical protein